MDTLQVENEISSFSLKVAPENKLCLKKNVGITSIRVAGMANHRFNLSQDLIEGPYY